MKKKVALYDPYLDVLGGGEKHILSMLKTVQDHDYDVYVFWDQDLSSQIQQRFNLNFRNKIHFLPNPFKAPTTLSKTLLLMNFDIFFYVTDGSYFFSTAKKNFVFCMVPDPNLYKRTFLNRIKTLNYRFITNSDFTKKVLRKNGVSSEVIYPYLEDNFINTDSDSLNKDKIILSVGRFFSHLHSKRQDVAIDMFNKLQQTDQMFKDFKLILAGGLKEEDVGYYRKLVTMAKTNPNIELQTNLSFDALHDLYKKSMFYWHMTGFGIDEKASPQLVEHLGITPLEAMASGCMTFCYKAGGPKEIIEDGVNGFLFTNEKELFKKMSKILKNVKLQSAIKKQSLITIHDKFTYPVFEKTIKKIILDS